jgi:hypothetical protein
MKKNKSTWHHHELMFAWDHKGFCVPTLVILYIDHELDLEGKLFIQCLPRMHPLHNGRLIITLLNPITI